MLSKQIGPYYFTNRSAEVGFKIVLSIIFLNLFFNIIEKRSRYVTLPWQQNFWMTTNQNVALKVDSHCFKLHRSYLIHLICQMLAKFSGLISKGPYLSLEKEKETFCVLLTFSIKWAREIRKSHVAVVQQRLRNVQKRVMHVQSCFFANLNLFFFW